MGNEKNGKKKCCGKFAKKGKHCGSCPISGDSKKCKADKSYCDDCEVRPKRKKEAKSKKKKKKK